MGEIENQDIAIDCNIISVRLYNCLNSAGVKTLGHAASMTKQQLMAIKNFGRRSYCELEDILEYYRLPLPENGEPVVPTFVAYSGSPEGEQIAVLYLKLEPLKQKRFRQWVRSCAITPLPLQK